MNDGADALISPYRLAVIGFTGFERSTLFAFLQLSKRQWPVYVHEPDIGSADMLVVDADRAVAFARTSPPNVVARSVFVGASAPEGCLAHLRRPLNLMALFRFLDESARRQPALSPRAAAPPETRAMTAPSRSLDDVLVVDESDIALRFMASCLTRFGFQVHLARSGDAALGKVAETNFRFVFLEIGLTGIDGYQTCKLIKRHPCAAGCAAPQVIMLTHRDRLFDKVRAALAGCDGYLTKPLDHGALIRVLGEHVVADAVMAETIHAPLPPM